MSTPKLTITITTLDKKLSKNVQDAVTAGKPYKYNHARLLATRLRSVKDSINHLSDEEQLAHLRNVLIVERNIASLAADEYSKINQENVFNDLMEIVAEIDTILKD